MDYAQHFTPYVFGFVTKQYKEMNKISYSGDIYKNTVAISMLQQFLDRVDCQIFLVISFGPSWFDETLIKGIHILMFSEEEYMTTV
jgi:hypothetical protein